MHTTRTLSRLVFLCVCISVWLITFYALNDTRSPYHTVPQRNTIKEKSILTQKAPSLNAEEPFNISNEKKNKQHLESNIKDKNTITPVLNKNNTYYVVTRVVDGDTFDVMMNDIQERVRVIGIDTPETVDPRKPVMCFGKEASQKAQELLLQKNVLLEGDSTQQDRDKYHRLLRYVHREDGLFFNKWMIEQGYAHEYTYHVPYLYQKEFKAAEIYAREHEKGLWNKNVCNL